MVEEVDKSGVNTTRIPPGDLDSGQTDEQIPLQALRPSVSPGAPLGVHLGCL